MYQILKTKDLYLVQQMQNEWFVTVGIIRKFRQRGAWYYHAVVNHVGSHRSTKENSFFQAVTTVLWLNGMSVYDAEQIAPSIIEKFNVP
jgi:hypothetical protein